MARGFRIRAPRVARGGFVAVSPRAGYSPRVGKAHRGGGLVGRFLRREPKVSTGQGSGSG